MGPLQVSVCAEDGVSLATSQVEDGVSLATSQVEQGGGMLSSRRAGASHPLYTTRRLYRHVFTLCAAVSHPGTALLSHSE